jgi:PPK2 family polyphosphate:nucleotide phosphotransferase
MSEQPLRVEPGTRVKLSDYDPDYTGDFNKKSARKALSEMREPLQQWQERLYAESKQALLVVFQAMDTGGKDGAIKNVFGGINPQGVRVASFKKPTSVELAHDFLWRVHAVVPAKGHIGVFNRSHYEDVLIVRVNSLIPEDVWSKRYDLINDFERLLAKNGTRILKFYLHIGKDEQRKRLQRRLDRPDRHWKFDIGDLPVRERWDDYMLAYEDALTKCSTEFAPWHIVPANRKWYRNLVIARTILKTLEDMNPQYPPTDLDVGSIVIPD